MKLVAVDPATKATGIALFDAHKLTHVALVRGNSIGQMLIALSNLDWPPEFGIPNVVIVERPVVYPRDGIKKAKDLISVAIVGGAAALAFGCEVWTETEFIEPRTWKGSVPKEIHNARVMNMLDSNEIEIIDKRLATAPPKLVHNVIDAVGIGLYKLGRM